ncbi:DEAD/DEAH box helicase family protein [Microbacteriaceae bacterium K1510]|nr:DEAD/DEAH box helicase family protein [Microbacteriaceae bacterium K1510]
MNEAETRAELIDPALRAAGWGVVADSRTRREEICPGRIEGAGRRGKKEIADYVLTFRNHKLAVIEAKAEDKGPTEGVAQAKAYADKLQARFAFATNGRKIYRIDMKTGAEAYVERYPTPDELWAETFQEANEWRERFADIPFEGAGRWEARYYQHNAIENALEAIAAGKQRILLTLATGTGKTAIAFQIAWALFQSRWNLSRKPERRPRILFLADRNILADQAYNSFAAFGEDGALARVKPEEIRKKGVVPKNASVFFTIFQTFMSGTGPDGKPAPYFGEYPPDFFDFIIIDECHRGGANDESNWRGILNYFAPAVQLGLTATPKRRDNVDTYKYFGEPVYVYSLKDGVNDGFLTPFKVKQIATTMDDYVWVADDSVVEGEVEEGKRYKEPDFNKRIEIEERERYRVRLFMDQIDQREKTLVFCATQTHAALVRDLVNQMKKSTDPNYCVRVTAEDGAIGDTWLRTFQDNEKTIPTILTTSQKLSTGVDARNVRNIVLMRPVNSMIEFKQIIGRGTRLFDGKNYFTIYDFVKAYEHFNDPEWDGEPMEPVVAPPKVPKPEGCEEGEGEPYEADPRERPKQIKIRLADGKERLIQSMMATTYWSPDGKPISANQMIERLFGELPRFFKDEDELRRLWSEPGTRKALLQALSEAGFGQDWLVEVAKLINAEKSDVFDVLAYVAYAKPPISRLERAESHKGVIFGKYDTKLQAFLEFVLAQYVSQGTEELDREKLGALLDLKYGSVNDAIATLGDAGAISDTFVGFQRFLYADRSGQAE